MESLTCSTVKDLSLCMLMSSQALAQGGELREGRKRVSFD